MQILSETDALAHTTSYTYDADNRLVALSGVKGNFAYAYDDAGNRISSTDANSNATQFAYDARKRLIKTTNPDKTTIVNSYDGPGNLASVTDQAGAVVQYAYDAANQLSTVVQLRLVITRIPSGLGNVPRFPSGRCQGTAAKCPAKRINCALESFSDLVSVLGSLVLSFAYIPVLLSASQKILHVFEKIDRHLIL